MRAGREAFPASVLQAMDVPGGNKEDTEKRLGRLLKRKTTKFSQVSLNLQLSPKVLSEAWALSPLRSNLTK